VRLTFLHIKVLHTAVRGSVADIFLPKWFADRIFPICGTIYLVTCVILAARLMTR
jgi:hypothetical protein